MTNRSSAILQHLSKQQWLQISRWEHEEIPDIVDARIGEEPEPMAARRNIVEHPFGTLKLWMGYTHFQMRTLDRFSTEMSLHVLSYNLKRVINLLGIKPLIQVLQPG
jgi:transposase